MKTEPALLIGLAGTIIVGILTQVAGSGIVVNSQGQSALNLLLVIVPLIVGFITRSFVTPVGSPVAVVPAPKVAS